MNCQNCSDSSSTTYSRCSPPLSTNCLFYQGEAKTCGDDFYICKGENMSDIQSRIFDKICSISNLTDVSTIIIPACLVEAWDNNDITVLNLFNLALSASCSLQEQINNVITAQETLNPTVTIRQVTNCACNNCTVQIKLSDALNNIITEICALKATVSFLQTQVNTVEAAYTGLQDQLTALATFNSNQILTNIDLQLRVTALETSVLCLKSAVGSC